MRTYRLEIRLLQLAIVLSTIILVGGFLGWSFPTGQTAKRDGASVNGAASGAQGAAAGIAKIVALGDSFTFGYPGGPDKSWTKRLADNLHVTVVNKGKIQQTSKDLLERFERDVASERPDLVIIFVGAGDALQGSSLADFQTSIKAMVEKARANHVTPVLALPLAFPGVEQAIKAMREWEESYAKEQRVLVLDFGSILFDAQGKYLKGFTADGKYPSAKGYEAMGDYAARVLR